MWPGCSTVLILWVSVLGRMEMQRQWSFPVHFPNGNSRPSPVVEEKKTDTQGYLHVLHES